MWLDAFLICTGGVNVEDGVKFIFKTLIKIPIIIAISYLIFNLFSFTVAYFRMYSTAQMLNSIVMENNYIPGDITDPTTQLGQLQEYIDNNLETRLLRNVEIRVIDKDTGNSNERLQYGHTQEVTLTGEFVWLLPLVNIQGEALSDGVEGIGGGGTGALRGDIDTQLQNRGFTGDYDASQIGDHGAQPNIVFSYEVPCMKYYSDLVD